MKKRKEFLSDPQKKNAYLVIETKKPVFKPIRRIKEEFEPNPWGAYRTEALKRFTRELLDREHEKIKSQKIRQSSH